MTSKDVLMLSAARTHATTGTGRAIRLAAGLSMAEVAGAVGVTEPTIWRWEAGKNRPRGVAAIRWAELLSDLKAAKKQNA
ncbi:helix-turn-helix domain-containing protein [Micromonosporaceae bacterium Da 78-11]